jgi:hypothetical protein
MRRCKYLKVDGGSQRYGRRTSLGLGLFRVGCLPGLGPERPGNVILGRSRKGLVGCCDGVTPLLAGRGLLSAHKRIQKSGMAFADFSPISIEAGWRGGELGPDTMEVVEGWKEVPTVRLCCSREPVARGLFHAQQIGVVDAAFAEPGNRSGRCGRVACLKRSPGLDQAESCERQAEFRHALFPGVERFGREQVPPGRIGLVLIERSGRPRAVAFYHFPCRSPRLSVPIIE